MFTLKYLVMDLVYVCYFQDVCGPCACFKHYNHAYSYMFSMTEGPLIKLVETGFHNVFKIKVVGEDSFRFFHIETFEVNTTNIVTEDE